MNEEKLKYDVKNYWNKETCGSWSSNKEKFTKEYFEEIEEFRYKIQPEIFAFAEFTRWHGKKILEVGVGAGTDFLQWARAGAKVFGVDLTEQACEHVRHRLNIYGFQAESIQVADCEKLPFQDNFFDLVWSWGVIHHT
ncbi:MAG TPA: class I SAM-dependent methyltransferase, partial [Candidatus Kapabacteria bacterium]|nr:class I SAM-dependent methyltransferase [Candidatus Kapabacteria bacterium]